MENNNKKNDKDLDVNKDRNNDRDKDLHWIPERNMATGFTFTGFLILIGIIVIVALVKYLFF
ncbi:hypothetical protein [Lysinibacillus sp. NPDC047702]|uniref:hypothetical protein n=1 Tax=unclassified Lysinibacillus TaxID=2636778 RepID=UPI003D0717D4